MRRPRSSFLRSRNAGRDSDPGLAQRVDGDALDPLPHAIAEGCLGELAGAFVTPALCGRAQVPDPVLPTSRRPAADALRGLTRLESSPRLSIAWNGLYSQAVVGARMERRKSVESVVVVRVGGMDVACA